MVQINDFKSNDSIRLTDVDGIVWTGKIEDVIFAKDNEPEVDSLIIRPNSGEFSGKLVEIFQPDIRAIEILG